MSRIHSIIDSVPEKEKLEIDYLKNNIDTAIADLVYDKMEEQKAYRIYFGERDQIEFQHLTDNYGMGNPTKIPSMRLMGSRIDYMVGKAMQNKLDYFVTCSNREALDLKMEEKRKLVLDEIQSQIQFFIGKVSEGQKEAVSEKFLKKLKQTYNDSWQASFEISTQLLLKRLIEDIDLVYKSKDLIKDYLVSGQMYWRNFVEELGRDPVFWICDPRDFFYEPNANSPWISDCRRVVYRTYVQPTEILTKHGHLMSEEDREAIAIAISTHFVERKHHVETVFYTNEQGEEIALTNGSYPQYSSEFIELYHVEWISVNPEKANLSSLDHVESKLKNIKGTTRLRKDRYEGWRANIGSGIYFGMGKSKFVNRSVNNPYECKLTYDGIVMRKQSSLDKNRSFFNFKPYSFILNTKDISDTYDITHYHLNNLMAAVRPGGTYEVLEHIPKVFGKSPTERILKSTGYEKTLGKRIISLAQEGSMPGEPGSVPFSNYGAYPSNVDGSLIEAFVFYIQNLEQQADRMLGLNDRMKGEMEERDGKAVTMNAVQQGELFTKEIFRTHGVALKRVLTNLANLSRISYKDGYIGAVVLGTEHKQFTIDGHTHSLADYNIYITDSADEKEDMMNANQLIMTAIQSQVVGFKQAFDMLLSRSISQKKQELSKAIAEQEESATGQLEQLTKQLEELNKQNEALNKRLESLKVDKMELEKMKVQTEVSKTKHDMKIDKEELELKEKTIRAKKEIDELKIKAEIMQMTDNNPYNDKLNWTR